MTGATATVHGVCDYLLGGSQHMSADREVGKAIDERFPSVGSDLRAARSFHLRAAGYLAGQGITRFIATGAAAWKPGLRNVHDAAAGADPAARTVYAGGDPEVHSWARALLGRGTASALASPGNAGELLSARPVAGMLGEGAPVCLMLAMRLQFMPARAARDYVRRCAAALPPGSVLVVSLALVARSPEGDALLAAFTPGTVYRHTADDVTGWLVRAGLGIVPPGASDVRRLLRGEVRAAGEPSCAAPGMTAGVLAAVP